MAQAAGFYRQQLRNSPRAIDYLKRRGLTGEIAARFGIGYAPDSWQPLEAAFSSYQDKALLDTGLVIENEQGGAMTDFATASCSPSRTSAAGSSASADGFSTRANPST